MPEQGDSAQPQLQATGAEDLRVVQIAFEGNKTTRERILRREMVLREGDVADAARIERSRQGIQDLGLFQQVSVRQEAVEGGVRLVYTVVERFYILPLPRAAANLDGQTSVGGELIWNNVWGLGHRLRLRALQNELRQADRGKQTLYSLGYTAPFVWDSPYTISSSIGHSQSPVTSPAVYDESFNSASLIVSRTFSFGGPASQGWTFGLGPYWLDEKRSGDAAPTAYGAATALVANAYYRDMRYRIYSEDGVYYGFTVSGAHDGLASDYNYSTLTGVYQRLLRIGETPHQNLNFSISAGSYFDGPAEVKNYNLGGSAALRAYKPNFLEGNAYYLVSAEFVRPIHWPWLRGAVILENGSVSAKPQDFGGDASYTSLGFSLRARIRSFVNLELEIGYALPLDGGEARLFGGRI